MYPILIADDEQKDRNIVKILLERRYPGQFLIREAENGQQALEILRREPVRLLLLDINMPGLSGIDVLHSLENRPYVIMLTACSHFVYTQEALRCGVRDYLLKPPLREEFYQAIGRFLADRQTQEPPQRVFTRELARQLMYYGDKKAIAGLLEAADIRGRLALCGLVRAEDNEEETLLEEVEGFLDRACAEYATAPWSEGAAVFLFCKNEEDAPAALECLARLRRHLEGSLCVSAELQTGLPTTLGGYPEAFLRLASPAHPVGGGPSLPAVQQAELERAVRLRDFGRVMACLRPVLGALDGAEDEDLVKSQLLVALAQCARQFQSRREAQSGSQQLSSLISAHGQEQVTDIAARYVHWLLQEHPGGARPQNTVVQMVLEKIRQDCGRQWSIDALADSFHVNAYYLSHLFKEHTGQSFTDYLAEYRIERAVSLMLTTDLSLAQIGEQVGYRDPNYFSRVFKKRRGVGPREFLRDQKTRTDLQN